MKLFFDTETTGKANFNAPPEDPRQPRLVQFAGLLTTDDGEEISSTNLIIRPRGFKIPDEAASIHGITTDLAKSVGVDSECAIGIYRKWRSAVDLLVAHNIQFDLFIMDIEACCQFHGSFREINEKEEFCTMRAMTPICKLPGNYSDYKWPKLQEAYRHAFGAEFEGAHDALADVRACARIYFWLMKRQQAETSAQAQPSPQPSEPAPVSP